MARWAARKTRQEGRGTRAIHTVHTADCCVTVVPPSLHIRIRTAQPRWRAFNDELARGGEAAFGSSGGDRRVQKFRVLNCVEPSAHTHTGAPTTAPTAAPAAYSTSTAASHCHQLLSHRTCFNTAFPLRQRRGRRAARVPGAALALPRHAGRDPRYGQRRAAECRDVRHRRSTQPRQGSAF